MRGTNSAHMSGLGHSLFAGLGIAEGSEKTRNKLNMATGSTRPLDLGQIQLLLPSASQPASWPLPRTSSVAIVDEDLLGRNGLTSGLPSSLLTTSPF